MTVIMASDAFYDQRLSFRVLVRLYVIDFLNLVRTQIALSRVINGIITDFSELTKLTLRAADTLKKIKQPNEDELVVIKKHFHDTLEHIKICERLEKKIAKINDKKLSEALEALQKALFKLEAVLHKLAASNNPIIKTPEYLKEKISGEGLKSILTKIN